MKKITQKALSLLLSFAMLLGMVQGITLPAFADETGGVTAYCSNTGLYKDSGYTEPISTGDTSYRYTITKVEFKSGTTTIADSALCNCIQLTSIMIPEGVKTIGDFAFSNCNALQSLFIPSSVESIGIDAFDSCYNLANVGFEGTTPPSGVGSMFGSYCTGITGIWVPSGTAQSYQDALGSASSYGGCITYYKDKVKAIGTVTAGAEFTSDVLCYKVNEDAKTVTITGYGMDFFSIPEIVCCNGHFLTVTAIGDKAFANCGNYFDGTIPASVTSIGEGAFAGCSCMQNGGTIPASVTSIGEAAFAGCSVSSFAVAAGNSSFSAADGVLFSKDGKTLVAYPAGNDDVSSYTIPSNVKSIADGAFADCGNLTSFDVSENSNFTVKTDGSLFKGTTLLAFPAGKTGLGDYTVPDGTTAIGKYAFYGNKQMDFLTLPKGVTSIGDGAFENAGTDNYYVNYNYCIVLPDSVESIGDSAFEGSKLFESVGVQTTDSQLKTIGDRAFADTYTTGLGVSTTSNTTFYGMTLPQNTETVGSEAFAGTGLRNTISIPASVTSIGGGAFAGTGINDDCGVKKFTVSADNSAYCAEDGILFTKDKKTLVAYPTDKRTASNGEAAVNYNIPGTVTAIGDGTFENCRNLFEITIPDSVTSIGKRAFQNCSDLTSVIIPQTVKTIGDSAFSGDRNLVNIQFKSTTPPTVGSGVFDNCGIKAASGGVWVPDDNAVAAYTGTAGFGDYCDTYNDGDTNYIKVPETVSAGDTITRADFELSVTDETNYTVTVTSCNLTDYSLAYSRSLGSIALPNEVTYNGHSFTVTAVDASAFSNDTYLEQIDVAENSGSFSSVEGVLFNKDKTELILYPNAKADTSYTIPNGVTTVGASAFCNSSLLSLTLPTGVTTMGDSALSGCTNLADVIFLGETPPTTIGADVFNSTSNLWVPSDDAVTAYKEAFSGYSNTISTTADFSLGDTFTFGSLQYTVTSTDPKTVQVFSPMESFDGGSVTIPETATYQGNVFTVTAITDSALSNQDLTSITIPSTVTSIGRNVFVNDSSLTKITVNESNTNYCSVDGVLFTKDMSTLVAYPAAKTDTNYMIPDSVTAIADSAFSGCTYLTSIHIPENVTTIGISAFSGCSGLTSINIPENVTTIDHYAFSHCSGLTSINIPENVTSIGNSAFYCCTGLTSIHIPENVTTIGEQAFAGCSKLTQVIIPAKVNTIDTNAFFYCASLTDVVFESENPPTSLATDIFDSCSSLTSIYVPNSDAVTSYQTSSWGSGSYHDLIKAPGTVVDNTQFTIDGLKYKVTDAANKTVDVTGHDGTCAGNLYIPKRTAYQGNILTVTSIGSTVLSGFTGAFQNCTDLTSVNIPESVVTVGNRAFSGCTGLTSINIPDNVTTIGNSAFFGCTGLTSVTIPVNVATIGGYAFAGDSNLTEITVDGSNANYCSIDGVLYNSDKSTLIAYPAGKAGASYTILPSVTAIGDGAFQGCTDLTSVTLPANIASIGEGAFYDCTGLVSETIPAGVTSILNAAFWNCTGLTDMVFESADPSQISTYGDYVFNNCQSLTIWVPSAALDGYQDLFSDYSDQIQAITPPEVGTVIIADGLKYTVTSKDPQTVAVTGCESCTGAIAIPETVAYHGNTLSVTSIGDNAFANCTGLTGVTIPAGVTSIGASAFSGCTSLANVTLKGKLASAGANAFNEGEGTSITFAAPDGTINYYKNLFNFTVMGSTAANFAGAETGGNSEHDTNDSNGSISGNPSASRPTTASDPATGASADLSGAALPSGVTSVSLAATPLTPAGLPVSSNGAGGFPDLQGIAAYRAAGTDTGLNLIGTPLLYSMSLLDQNGASVNPQSGSVTVKLPLPTGLRGTPHVFLYDGKTGKLTDMNASVQNGTLVFQTSSFGDYIIAGTGDSISLDTTSYTMPENGSYQIGIKLTGSKAASVKVTSTDNEIATVTRLANGNYQVTGKSAGTAYIMFDVYDNKNNLLTHASVRVDVKTGIRQRGDSARQYGIF